MAARNETRYSFAFSGISTCSGVFAGPENCIFHLVFTFLGRINAAMLLQKRIKKSKSPFPALLTIPEQGINLL